MVNNMVQICAVLHLTCVSGRRFQESSLRKLRPAKMGTTAPRIAFFSDDLVRPGVENDGVLRVRGPALPPRCTEYGRPIHLLITLHK